jgi:hypothetical protein
MRKTPADETSSASVSRFRETDMSK